MKKWNKKDGSKKRIALGVAGAAGAFVLGASLFTAVPAVAGGFGLGPADGTGNNATTQAAGKAETSVPRAASDRACPGYWDTDGDGICATASATPAALPAQAFTANAATTLTKTATACATTMAPARGMAARTTSTLTATVSATTTARARAAATATAQATARATAPARATATAQATAPARVTATAPHPAAITATAADTTVAAKRPARNSTHRPAVR